MNCPTCQHALDLLLDYLADELTPEAKADLELHLHGCQPCNTYLETYRLTITYSRQLPKEAPLPPDFESRLLEMMRAFQAEWERRTR